MSVVNIALRLGQPPAVIDFRPQQLRAVIRRREARARHFSSDLFADPAWDILLDLALARMTARPAVLRVAASMSPSAVERWIDLLVEGGYVTRRGTDAMLSDTGLASVQAWLAGA